MKKLLALVLAAMLCAAAGAALAAAGGAPADQPGVCGHFHKTETWTVLRDNATEATHRMVYTVLQGCALCGQRVLSVRTVEEPEAEHVSDGEVYDWHDGCEHISCLKCAVCGQYYREESVPCTGRPHIMPVLTME